MMGDPETQREMQEMQQNMANTQNQVTTYNLLVCSTPGERGGHRKFPVFSTTAIYPYFLLFQMPEVSEVFANLFGGGGSTSQDKTKKKQNRVQRR